MEQYIDSIQEYLNQKAISCERCQDTQRLLTTHILGPHEVTLSAELPRDFPTALPRFHLANRKDYGALAHVAWGDGHFALICHGNEDNINIDYERPEVVFFDTLKRALKVLEKALCDEKYNESELLREFSSVWRFHVRNKIPLICIAEAPSKIEEIAIRHPDPRAKFPTAKRLFAISRANNLCNSRHTLLNECNSSKRTNRGKGLIIPIENLIPPPAPSESIKDWWIQQLSTLDKDIRNTLRSHSRRNKSKLFYLIICSKRNSNPLWFGIKCHHKKKSNAPIHQDFMGGWLCEAVNISPISTETTLPRSGASVKYTKQSVCIVGCGSLGSNIAEILASSGVGKLTLIDNDVYNIENIHRHRLSTEYLFCPKSKALEHQLLAKFPFLSVASQTEKLLDIPDPEYWKQFDLIIAATGSATSERRFDQFVKENRIDTPTIYTWLEPFGAGGHALASIPNKKGCLSCIYVDNLSDTPSLYPNINFIAPNQNILSSIGGCGDDYLAYSNNDAIQTSVIAVELATKCLNSELEESVSISWKGGDEQLVQQGIRTTHRYEKFKAQLTEVPIHRGSCPICNA